MSLSNIRQILSTNEIELFQRKSVPPCLGFLISREVGMKNIRGYPGGRKNLRISRGINYSKKGYPQQRRYGFILENPILMHCVNCVHASYFYVKLHPRHPSQHGYVHDLSSDDSMLLAFYDSQRIL